MFQDTFDSFSDVFSRPFRRVTAKSLVLTTAALLPPLRVSGEPSVR
jgi:hypothetical protein